MKKDQRCYHDSSLILLDLLITLALGKNWRPIRHWLRVYLQLEVTVVAVFEAGMLPEERHAEGSKHEIILVAKIGHIFLIALGSGKVGQWADQVVITEIVTLFRRDHGLGLKDSGKLCRISCVLRILFLILFVEGIDIGERLMCDRLHDPRHSIKAALIGQHH